jgi:hypothetical protein
VLLRTAVLERIVRGEIEGRPAVAARVLAQRLDYEKDWLKPQIRKLKDLGLTVSLPVGYELSPRGRVVVERLKGSRA